MNISKILSTAIFALTLFLGSSLGTYAQDSKTGNQEEGFFDKIEKYFWSDGEEKKVEQSYFNKRSGKKTTVTIQDPSLSDINVFSQLGTFLKGANSLDVEEINLAPDYDAGKFFLSFNIEDEETTKILILDVAGTEIHNETIEDFSGTYESAVGIQVDQPGTYFLKIIQGFNLLNKKLVIE